MKAAVIDTLLFSEFLENYLSSTSRYEKKEIISIFAKKTGMSIRTIYRRIALATNKSLSVATGFSKKPKQSRKSQALLDEEKRDATLLSSIKTLFATRGSYCLSTVRALSVAHEMKMIDEGKYTRSKMDTLLRYHELNYRAYQIPQAVMRITAKHPGHVFVVDASPMNQYYMNVNQKIKSLSLPRGDTHKDDILARDGLSKIWVYYCVDMFSGAYLCKAYAPKPKGKNSKNGGENSEDWVDFLEFCFLPKEGLAPLMPDKQHPLEGCVVEGAPKIVFSDKGSGLTSKATTNFLTNLGGIKVTHHLPEHPSAKGLVEGRIGSFKRSFEVLLQRRLISSLDEINHFYSSWSNHSCIESGYHDNFLNGLKDHKLIKVTPQNIIDARTDHVVRVVDGFGSISTEGKRYFTCENWRTKKVKIFRCLDNDGETRLKAQLGEKIINCDPNGDRSHDFEDIKSFPKSEAMLLREEANSLHKVIKDNLKLEHILPPKQKEKIVRLPAPWEALETNTIVPPSHFLTIKAAKTFITDQTGLLMEEISEDLYSALETTLQTTLTNKSLIPTELLLQFCDILKENTKEKINLKGINNG
jgi:hypothetical protein